MMEPTSSERLRAWRKGKGISQRELASALGYAQGYIGNIEAGRSEPSRNFLIGLQEKFGVRADYILYGDGDPVAAPAPPPPAPPRIDPLLLTICGAMVRQEYANLGLALTPEAQFDQAVWVYDQFMSRLPDPSDGAALERTMPEVRVSLRSRLSPEKAR